MKAKNLQNIGLFILAFIFSIGLMFAFIELPRIADNLLQANVGTPFSDPAYNPSRFELFYDAYAIRLIGYICLTLILLFIIVGFTTRKRGWALAGSIALFLPVFATFAHSMFYLAGLGLFNVFMFPFIDISTSLIDLGKVVLIPYWFLMWFFKLFNWYAHTFISYFFMISGAFIFVLGVFVWLKTRYNKLKVAKHWIYKYSRHPQYLGWIIWSYGLMLYGPTLNEMKKSWGWHGTLPWLLSTLVIIGICMLEELKMKEIADDDYEEYRNRTPFLFPVPKLIKQILKAPSKLITRSPHPKKRKEVGLIVILYTIIFMGLSLFWVDFSHKENESRFSNKPYNQHTVDSILVEIHKPLARRYRSIEPFFEIASMGEKVHPVLINLMSDTNDVIREFAIKTATQFKIKETIPELIHALSDSNSRVAHSAIRGLADLEVKEAIDTMLYLLKYPRMEINQDILLSALSKLRCTEVMPYLVARTESNEWYKTTGALRSMMQLDIELAKPYIYKALDDERPEVRREAVYMLLDTLPEDAIPHLQKVINDENWEVRFYAKQTIKLINHKN